MHKSLIKSGRSGLHAVILAAGASRRYGAPKQLARYRGEFLLARSVRLAQAAGADAVTVVLGYRADLIARALQATRTASGDAIALRNPRWRDGMGRSLACGICAVPPRARAALVCLSDQPMLDAEDLVKLVTTWRDNPRVAVASHYAGRLGVPAIFPRSLFGALKGLSEDRGAQAILASAKGVVGVPMPDAEVDIDYPGDLSQLPR